MNKTPVLMLIASLMALPTLTSSIRADESAMQERRESPEKQAKEEQKALDKYNKAVAKYGKDSAQAKKAWKRYQHELREHGHHDESGASAPTTK